MYKILLVLISLISIIGSILYHLIGLGPIGILLTLALSVLGVMFYTIKMENLNKLRITNYKLQINDKKNFLLLIIYLLLIAYLIYTFITSATKNSITSPWQVLSVSVFPIFLLSTFILILIVNNSKKFLLPLISFHFFITFSVLLFIFKIGFGYDPFIHQASMDIIKNKGFIEPKTFYYIGQYSIILVLNKIFFISIPLLDKLLVPFLSALFIPVVSYYTLKKYFEDKNSILLSIILLLLLPFSFLTLTTPQNLSFLFFILTILFSWKASNKEDCLLPILLALATFSIHPLSGIPALIIVMALFIKNSKIKIKQFITPLLIAILTIILPVIFGILNGFSGFNNISFKNLLNLELPNYENIFLNIIHGYSLNIFLIIIIIAIACLIIYFKNKKIIKSIWIFPIFSLSLFISYVLLLNIRHPDIIDYEQADYANRSLILAGICLLPLLLSSFYKLFEQINKQTKYIKYTWLIFIAMVITCSFFTSYPRKDNYLDSHGLSVSEYDLEAVEWIAKDALNKKYIVLANQQVSVATLKKIGFNYLDNGHLFYPIPTGGELYKYYLLMVYEDASRETALEAMNFGDVDTLYFVLNNYWWAFDKIMKEAQFSANSFEKIDNGKIYIFKYTK